MPSKSFRDLFADQPSPTPQPVAPVVAKANGGGWAGLLLAVALFAGFFYAQKFDWKLNPWGGDGQQQEQQGEVVKGIKPGYVIVLSERQDPTAAEIAKVKMVEAFCLAQKDKDGQPLLEFRNPDDDDTSEAVAKIRDWAKSKGVSPPCVVYKLKDGNELRKAIALPSNETELKGVFK